MRGALAATLAVAGCSQMPSLPGVTGTRGASGAIHVEVPVPALSSDPVRVQGRVVSVAVPDFTDARAGSPGRRIGAIRATVRDMHASELRVDEDVPTLLSGAARRRLAAEGFRVVAPGEAADLRLEVVVRTFSLEIAGRDELAIVADASLRSGSGAQAPVAWKGEIAERSDRYAGVSGNSSATIAEYLGEGVAAFSGKIAAAVRAGTGNAALRPVAAPVSGTPQPAAAPSAAAGRPAADPGAGRLWVLTTPARAKVYIDQVYFGLTPLKLELAPGIVEVRLSLAGFRPVTERVSVRQGDVTELEVSLEK
jgi:hypothetical protein